jgi:hypothetical protein
MTPSSNINLDVIKRIIEYRISKEELDNVHASVVWDHFDRTAQNIILQLEYYCAKDDLGQVIEIVEMPASWFDHFKRDVWNEWMPWKLKVKLKIKEIKFDVDALYPKLNLPLDEGRYRPVFRIIKESEDYTIREVE